MFSGSECDPLDCDTPSLADESKHARKDAVSKFRVKVSRVLLHHHLTPTTKIENILSIIYQATITYVTEFDLNTLHWKQLPIAYKKTSQTVLKNM